MPSSFHIDWTATAISRWPGESLRRSVTFRFGLATSLMSSLACSMSPASGIHGEFGLMVSNPGMPSGVKPVVGS